jgi:hypothetical protein
MSMKTLAATVLLAASTLAAGPVLVSAQSAPPQYIHVVRVEARLGELSRWEAYQRQLVEAQRRVGDHLAVTRFQSRMGGPINEFHVVIPFQDFSELDRWRGVPALLREAYGDEEGTRIRDEGNGLEVSVEIAVHALLPEFSSGMNKDVSGFPITQLVVTDVDPARTEDYQAFLGAVAKAEDARGIRRIRRLSTIGELNRYSSIEQFRSFAEFRTDPSPQALVLEEYGPVVGQSLLDGANAAIRRREILVFQVREDLSYRPE